VAGGFNIIIPATVGMIYKVLLCAGGNPFLPAIVIPAMAGIQKMMPYI
jgi:hypothetical protein